MAIGALGALARFLPTFGRAVPSGVDFTVNAAGAARAAAAGFAPGTAGASSAAGYLGMPTFTQTLRGLAGGAGNATVAGAKGLATAARVGAGVANKAFLPAALGMGAYNLYEDTSNPHATTNIYANELADDFSKNVSEGRYLRAGVEGIGDAGKLGGAVLNRMFNPFASGEGRFFDGGTVSPNEAIDLATRQKGQLNNPYTLGDTAKEMGQRNKQPKFEVDKAAAAALKPFGIVGRPSKGNKGGGRVPADRMTELLSRMTPQQINLVMKHFKPVPQKQRSNKDLMIGDIRAIGLQALRNVIDDPNASKKQKQTAMQEFLTNQRGIVAPNALTPITRPNAKTD